MKQVMVGAGSGAGAVVVGAGSGAGSVVVVTTFGAIFGAGADVVTGADVAAGADVVTASVGVCDGVGVAVTATVAAGGTGVDWLTRCIAITPAVPDTRSTANAAPMIGTLFLILIIFCSPRNAGWTTPVTLSRFA